jgi:hypothetical protein
LKVRVEEVLNSRNAVATAPSGKTASTRGAAALGSRQNRSQNLIAKNLAGCIEDVDSDPDALDDPKEHKVTADYLEALSRQDLHIRMTSNGLTWTAEEGASLPPNKNVLDKWVSTIYSRKCINLCLKSPIYGTDTRVL